MKFSVYRFSDVLRALRNEAGLTVLQAEEATSYCNYERWESGQTRVGAQHLANIAAAFDVGEDLWLLMYAWLVDRCVPRPGAAPTEPTGADLRRHRDLLPGGDLQVDAVGGIPLGSMSHGDLALLALVARYGPGYATEGQRLTIRPMERSASDPVPAGARILPHLYGDVMRDVLQYIARTCVLAGLNALRGKAKTAVDRFVLLLLSEPEQLGQLLAAGRPPEGTSKRGLNRLAWLAARLAPRMQRLASRQLEDLRRAEEVIWGEPVSLDEVKAAIKAAARDDAFWAGPATESLSPSESRCCPTPTPTSAVSSGASATKSIGRPGAPCRRSLTTLAPSPILGRPLMQSTCWDRDAGPYRLNVPTRSTPFSTS